MAHCSSTHEGGGGVHGPRRLRRGLLLRARTGRAGRGTPTGCPGSELRTSWQRPGSLAVVGGGRRADSILDMLCIVHHKLLAPSFGVGVEEALVVQQA